MPKNDTAEIEAAEPGLCPQGFPVVVLYYNDRNEFYLQDGTLFAVFLKKSEKVYILQPDKSVKVSPVASAGSPCDAAEALLK